MRAAYHTRRLGWEGLTALTVMLLTIVALPVMQLTGGPKWGALLFRPRRVGLAAPAE